MGPVPQRSEPKKSRKIFFLWPQSTKKVTHVPVFEKILFLGKNFEKKIALQGGVAPPGGAVGGVAPQGGVGGGCRARKKKVTEKISIFFALIDL